MSEVEPQTQPDETPDETPEETPEAPPVAPTPDEEDEAAEAEEQAGAAPDEAEPEQPQGLSQKQLEQALGKLEREAERHAKRVGEIMGDEIELLLACPLCDPLTPGKIMPTPATPERFPAVRAFMGDAEPQEWQQDPNTRTCQTCAGMGEVKTGSKVQSQTTLVCTDCGGKGWQGQRPAVASTGPMAASPLPDVNGREDRPAPTIDPPDVAELKRRGYTVIDPVGA
jgi:hypothetical protein